MLQTFYRIVVAQRCNEAVAVECQHFTAKTVLGALLAPEAGRQQVAVR